ncbi:MAG: membrane dipeptidase [Pseudomonadales bacterium]|nr:membrane dipeptidase [Pseudomonadales bacterium]MDG1441309.1 membrane dipeptidase [Pseudomonadales bacterium]
MNLTRRKLIKVASASLAASASSFVLAVGKGEQVQNFCFDFHCHPGMFPRQDLVGAGADAVEKTVSEMVVGQLSGAFFATVSDALILELGPTGPRATRAFEPGEAFADFKRQLARFKLITERQDVVFATQSAQAEVNPGKVLAYFSCEGGDFIEQNLDRLDEVHADGVRSIQLVHYVQNNLGDMQTGKSVYDGLSSIGRQVVKQMNRLGMIIDVAHSSFKTAQDAAELSSDPLLLSHSHLQWGEYRHPRLLTKDHAKLIAQTGGVIGMWPSGIGNTDFDNFLDNTARLVELVGVDHVGLGTDMDGNFKPVFSRYLQMPDWREGLRGKGFSYAEVAKIIGGNAQRLLTQVL